MTSLEGVPQRVVRPADVHVFLSGGGRDSPLVAVANGTLMARRSSWSWCAHGSGVRSSNLTNLCALPAHTLSLLLAAGRFIPHMFRIMDGWAHRPSAFQAGRIPRSPCKVRVFACAADRRRLRLAVAVTVAVSGGWEDDARTGQAPAHARPGSRWDDYRVRAGWIAGSFSSCSRRCCPWARSCPGGWR
jgi:hypothetical protein